MLFTDRFNFGIDFIQRNLVCSLLSRSPLERNNGLNGTGSAKRSKRFLKVFLGYCPKNGYGPTIAGNDHFPFVRQLFPDLPLKSRTLKNFMLTSSPYILHYVRKCHLLSIPFRYNGWS